MTIVIDQNNHDEIEHLNDEIATAFAQQMEDAGMDLADVDDDELVRQFDPELYDLWIAIQAFINERIEVMYQPTQFSDKYTIKQRMVTTLLAFGFIDTSWGNNICPSFDLFKDRDDPDAGYITIWIDAAVQAYREDNESNRFSVSYCKPNGMNTDDYEQHGTFSLALADAIARAAKYNIEVN